MTVSLTPDLETLINAQVASGNYHSANEVVREGLRLLSEKDALRETLREDLRREVQSGFDSIARGNFTEYDGDSAVRIADEVKAEGRRKAASRVTQVSAGSGK